MLGKKLCWRRCFPPDPQGQIRQRRSASFGIHAWGRMLPKEILWIGAKGGLLAEKHYYAMKDAIWLFQWLLLRQTGLNEIGEGIVNYGHPITRAEIQEDTGFGDWRIERWTDRLRRTDYIRTEKRGNDGLIFFVLAAKHKTKKARVAATMLPHKPEVTTTMLPPHKNAATYTTEDKKVTLVGGSLIPKDLSYPNKDAAAKTAAEVKSLSKQKEIPKPKTWEQQKAEARQKGYLQ